MAPALVEKSHGWFRSWFRKVWKLRGGGLYACGFAITFIIYEVQSLADDVLGLAFVGFGSYLKKPIEGWLFGDEPELAEEPEA